jgi:hypothetical protein
VSYESRRKKGAYKRGAAKARRSPETPKRWFLTLAKRPGRCGGCGDRFERGTQFVYRHEDRAVRCLRCADADPECRYRASQRWEKARRVPRLVA